MSNEMTIYKETNNYFDAETGELKSVQGTSVTRNKKSKEQPYIRVYKYMNTVFAFNNIPLKLTPYVIEFGKYMGNPEDDQQIAFDTYIKERICEVMGVKIDMLNKVIKDCVKYDILRKTKHRGRYSVNPFVISQGERSQVEELQAKFDFMANSVKVGAVQRNLITSTIIKKAIIDDGKKNKQLAGQTSIFDRITDESQSGADELLPDNL